MALIGRLRPSGTEPIVCLLSRQLQVHFDPSDRTFSFTTLGKSGSERGSHDLLSEIEYLYTSAQPRFEDGCVIRIEMDILRIASEAGMQVILDARIGREEYKSVIGTVEALQRFVDAMRAEDDQGRLQNPAVVERNS